MMHIITPKNISPKSWEGRLIANTGRLVPSASVSPIVTLAHAKIWPITDMLLPQDTPPAPNTAHWLVQYGIHLHQPANHVSNITEAQLSLYLCPQDQCDLSHIYAHSLFPTQTTGETPSTYNVILSQDLSFAYDAAPNGQKTIATIIYHKAYPITQGHGVGKCTPYWIFKPRHTLDLVGCQFIYAVIAASTEVRSIDLIAELIVTVNTLHGPIRFGLPPEAKSRSRFKIP